MAVASRELARAQEYARKHQISRAYGSYSELLADPDIDVIYNSLPNHLHSEWSIRALEAGKHVLCEKPLALSLAEVDAMQAAAQRSGRILAEAFMYRHHPQTLRVKEIVQSGVLGEIRLVRGAFTFNLHNKDDYRMDSAMGGGSLWDVGCYPVSYTRFLLDAEPVEVCGWQRLTSSGVDDTFSGQMRFANGALAQFDSGFSGPYRTFMEIVGSEQSLFVHLPFSPQPWGFIYLWRGIGGYRPQWKPMIVRGPALYEGEVEDIADAVLLGNPQRMSLADSRANAACLLALLESARSGGKPVEL